MSKSGEVHVISPNLHIRGNSVMNEENFEGAGMSFKDVAETMIEGILEKRARIEDSGEQIILDTKDCWSVKDTRDEGVRYMSDEALRCTIIEDLLYLYQYEKDGRLFDFKSDDMGRHVYPDQKTRVAEALKHPDLQKFLNPYPDGQLRINSSSRDILIEAMDYCGVYLDGFIDLDLSQP